MAPVRKVDRKADRFPLRTLIRGRRRGSPEEEGNDRLHRPAGAGEESGWADRLGA